MKQIQIYEVENTNLLYIVTDRNQDASYYSKSNLRVEAVDRYVVMWNNDVQFFRELPSDFVTPTESSVVDLVEIIQGFINNILPVSNDELDALKELVGGQIQSHFLLSLIEKSVHFNAEILRELKINNLHNHQITGELFTEDDVKD